MTDEAKARALAAIRVATPDLQHLDELKPAIRAGLAADPEMFAFFLAVIARDAIGDRDVDAFLSGYS